MIPEEYAGRIIDLIEKFGVFEANTQPYPMSRDTQRYVKRTARGVMKFMDEGQPLSADTKPALANKALQAKKGGYFVTIPNEVTEDQLPALGEMMARDIAEAFAYGIDNVAFNATGTADENEGSITGIIASLVQNAAITGSGDTWPELVRDDFTQVISALKTSAFDGVGPKWYCSHAFYWQVMAPIVLDAGGVTAAEMEGRRSLMFLGFPVELTQVLPSTGAADTVACVFGNLRAGTTFGDRRELTIKFSEHFQFSADVTAVLATRRFDIKIDGAGTGTGGSSVPEVIAALKTAAA